MSPSPKISVIVPIFKAEKYLKRCIDSILAQTFPDFELLLVDDGSPDNSGNICDDYAEHDSRVRVFHKENGGVSSARNVGLNNAIGQWIYFCDPDDYLYVDTLEILVKQLAVGVDMVLGGYVEEADNGDVIYYENLATIKSLDVKEAFIVYFTQGDYKFQGYLWNRLFNHDIIYTYNLRFDENIYYKEDGLFIVKYLCRMIGQVIYITRPIYHYVVHPEGAMGALAKGVNDKFLTNLDARILSFKEIKEYFPDSQVIRLAKESIFGYFVWVASIMLKTKKIQISVLYRIGIKVLMNIGLMSFFRELLRWFMRRTINHLKLNTIND